MTESLYKTIVILNKLKCAPLLVFFFHTKNFIMIPFVFASEPKEANDVKMFFKSLLDLKNEQKSAIIIKDMLYS